MPNSTPTPSAESGTPPRIATGFEDFITCPSCGAVDGDVCDYPRGDFGFRAGSDGGTAAWDCECGAQCMVTLSVSYNYSTALVAAEGVKAHAD